MIRALLVMTTCMLCLASTRADAGTLSRAQQETLVQEALAAYDRGVDLVRTTPGRARIAFEEAASKLQLVVDDGIVNGHLYYNLGNAYFQTGDLGQAILWYRSAERMLGGDEALQRNLAAARGLRRTRIEPSGRRALLDSLLAWHRDTSIRTRFTIGLTAYLIFWTVLGVRLVRGRPSPTLRWTAIVTGIVWVGAGVSVAAERSGLTEAHEGVIVRDDVTVRKGNGVGFERAFDQPIHQGVEFELIERRDDWFEIRLPDDHTGWVRADEAALIG